MLLVNFNNYKSSWLTQIIWIAIVSYRRSDLTSCKQNGEPGLVALSTFAIASENKIEYLFSIIW